MVSKSQVKRLAVQNTQQRIAELEGQLAEKQEALDIHEKNWNLPVLATHKALVKREAVLRELLKEAHAIMFPRHRFGSRPNRFQWRDKARAALEVK